MVQEQLDIHIENTELHFLLHAYTDNNLRHTIKLNVKTKIIKLLEDNTNGPQNVISTK